ncbi:hypothetical protein B0T26DRAFT_875347 [Lasiosphaeria miniovina]|uniref:Uncharacterized protein n=1 Tax=Lasiosphaeria miniovina TaxID=1954250 RepID=A0AA39ZYN9_9PEZI|nr:uncharacterized protein B0T26DRAFT_875347 [Lasiosphaeria miniovina]KAK0706091.1 hypothetical protein B0T26DRAFT_875347 [Lasiosphaeria miniovina]
MLLFPPNSQLCCRLALRKAKTRKLPPYSQLKMVSIKLIIVAIATFVAATVSAHPLFGRSDSVSASATRAGLARGTCWWRFHKSNVIDQAHCAVEDLSGNSHSVFARIVYADPVGESKNFAQWGNKNAMVNNSLSKAVHEKLVARNWNTREQNPKVTYDLIKEVIPRVTQEAVIDFVFELAMIERKSFTTMSAFLTRLRFLHTKITDLKAGVTEQFHLDLLIAKLKKSYPKRHLFWVNSLKEHTMTWNKLNQELEEIAASGQQRTKK